MRSRTPTSLHDKRQSLLDARGAAAAEVTRLDREEEHLLEQVRQAQEQVRYYENLLSKLRRDWSRPARFDEIVRRLG